MERVRQHLYTGRERAKEVLEDLVSKESSFLTGVIATVTKVTAVTKVIATV